MAFTPAKDILKSVFKKCNLNEDSFGIFQLWEKILGRLSKNTRIVIIKKREITVEVDSSVYLQELSLRKKELIEELNKGLKKMKLKDIRLKIRR